VDVDPSRDTSVTPADTSISRISGSFLRPGAAAASGIFDVEGHNKGLSTQVLPQGRYIVRQKEQGRSVNKMFIKK